MFCGEFAAGNPCGVVVLERWLSDAELLDLTREIAQPVTSFVLVEDKTYHIRWFSLLGEINLCGHGSLGAGAEIIKRYQRKQVDFQSRYGQLRVSENQGFFSMTLPSWRAKPYASNMLGNEFLLPKHRDVFTTRDMVLVLDSEAAVASFKPDFEQLKLIEDQHAFMVTAQSSDNEYVLRYFAPKIGIPEDLATGSAHCSLAPYWFDQLKCRELYARQLSSSGGQFKIEKASNQAIVLSAQAKPRI